MKFYYSPGACSLAVHIALREADIKAELIKVDLKAKKTASGEDYLKINPQGYVPFLELGNGEKLGEVAVLLQYVAEQNPEAGLAPKFGDFQRYRCMEWLNYIATEIHKGFAPLWRSTTPEETKKMTLEKLQKSFGQLADHFSQNQFLMGAEYSIADSYLFTVLNWTNFLKMDLLPWPNLKAYWERVGARPAVREAMKTEGLQ